MSFHTTFTGRSKNHALELLEANKRYLPAPVFDFIANSINNLPPARDGYQRVVEVKASGHLCDGNSSAQSSATIEVKPTEIPD